MCDIECMLHQFQVSAEEQDYLRSLWCENGDFMSEPSVYHMKLHLFGAASGCANYGLKYIAALGHGRFSEATIHFIERTFYADDGLISVSRKEEAIQKVNQTALQLWQAMHPPVHFQSPRGTCTHSRRTACMKSRLSFYCILRDS